MYDSNSFSTDAYDIRSWDFGIVTLILAAPGILHKFQFDRNDMWPRPQARNWPFRRV